MQGPWNKMVIAVLGITVLGVGAKLWYGSNQPHVRPPTWQEEKTPIHPVPYVRSIPEPIKEKGFSGKEGLNLPEPFITPQVPPVPLPAMDQSDPFVRELIKNLCLSHIWTEWLKQDNLIRRVTAAVDNIASGISPRPHLGFLKPHRPFSVKIKNGVLILDPESFKRYNTVADIFSSLDAQSTVHIYLSLEPLFQQAYRDLGYPDGDFRHTLVEAIERILQTPMVRGDIPLIPAEQGINARFQDEGLEDLSPAQKHLIRFGPENTRKIQEKVRDMALTLGVPGESLPKPLEYAQQPNNPAPAR